ncbi:MAG: hypothetical protein ACOX6W_01780 [Lentisphaeria bacterium]|jgi:hypothetical protein
MRQFSTLQERYIEAFLPDDLSVEVYDNALGELKKFLEERYPESHYTSHQNWNCNIVISPSGAPKLESKLSFAHDIWSKKKNKNEQRDWRVRIEKKRLIINYCKNKIEDSGSFPEFLNFCEPIINFYLNKLAIPAFPNIKLSYQFKYDFNTVANKIFCDEKWIEIKDIFTIFASTYQNAPNDFMSFIPPYQHEQTLRLKDDFLLHSNLTASERNEKLAIFMTLSAWQSKEAPSPCSLLSVLFDKLKIIYCLMLTKKVRDYLKDDWK